MEVGEAGQSRAPQNKSQQMPQFAVQHYRGGYTGHENGVIPQYSIDNELGIEQGNGIQALHAMLLPGQLPQDSDGLRRYLVDLQTETARLREARAPPTPVCEQVH